MDILTGCLIRTASMNLSWLSSAYCLSQEIMALFHSKNKFICSDPSWSEALSILSPGLSSQQPYLDWGRNLIQFLLRSALSACRLTELHRQAKAVCSQRLQKMDLEKLQEAQLKCAAYTFLCPTTAESRAASSFLLLLWLREGTPQSGTQSPKLFNTLTWGRQGFNAP